jgi:hypothetical protein
VQLGITESDALLSCRHTRFEQGQSAFKQLANVCSRRMVDVDLAVRKEKELKSCILAKVLELLESRSAVGLFYTTSYP